MADTENKELWEQGECSLFKARMDRRKADTAKRKAGRKALKAEDVKMEWEQPTAFGLAAFARRSSASTTELSKSTVTSIRLIPTL